MKIDYEKPLTELSLELLIEENKDEISWYDISKNQRLSEAFIEKYQDKINWIVISKHQKLSEAFIEKHQDKLNWEHISYHQRLSEPFIAKFKHRVDWFFIAEYQNLSETFIKEHQDKIGKARLLMPNKVDNRSLKTKMQDMEDYAFHYHLDIQNNYLYAFREHDQWNRGMFNKTIFYDKPGVYRDWKCDLNENDKNSYGLGIFPIGNVRVRVHVNDWGIWVRGTDKARVWAFRLFETRG